VTYASNIEHFVAPLAAELGKKEISQIPLDRLEDSDPAGLSLAGAKRHTLTRVLSWVRSALFVEAALLWVFWRDPLEETLLTGVTKDWRPAWLDTFDLGGIATLAALLFVAYVIFRAYELFWLRSLRSMETLTYARTITSFYKHYSDSGSAKTLPDLLSQLRGKPDAITPLWHYIVWLTTFGLVTALFITLPITVAFAVHLEEASLSLAAISSAGVFVFTLLTVFSIWRQVFQLIETLYESDNMNRFP
jgi:hypothetical protein